MSTPKPNLNRIWAAGAPGANVVDPGDPKFDAGWVAEIPPFENFNYLQQLFTQGLAYLNEQGIGVYDNTTDYPIYGLTKGSDGEIYRCLIANGPSTTVVNPVADSTATWELATNTLYITVAGTDTYTANNIPVSPNVPRDGQVFLVDFTNDNTGAATLNGTDIKLASGDDPAAGQITGRVTLVYDFGNGWFELVQPPVKQATESLAGIAELATQSETDTGSDDQRIVTPLKLAGGGSRTIAALGHIVLPSWLGGLIIQWGSTGPLGSNSGIDLLFSTTFPNAALSVVTGSAANSSDANDAWLLVRNVTTTGFRLANGGSAGQSSDLNYYVAVGY